MKMLERYYDEITDGMGDERANIQAVNVTSASVWFYSVKSWCINDFPVVVPPFNTTWMEFDITSASRGFYKDVDSIGCFCKVYRCDPGDVSIENDLLIKSLLLRRGQEYPIERKEIVSRIASSGIDAGWHVFWNVYISNSNNFDELFSVIGTIGTNGAFIPEMSLFGSTFELDGLQDRCEYIHSAFLFATSLMHAKNVSLVDDPLPAQIAKRRAKEGKPVITFKTLSIEPMRKRAINEAPGTSGAKRAMHIVRGHFKDYRDGGGLFGKMNGLYWWDMHVAGNADNGQIVKDYKIGKVAR